MAIYKTYICHSENCVWYKIGPDPTGKPMHTPTCHHPTTEVFDLAFPLMDEPQGAYKCRRFKQEAPDKVQAKLEAHA